MGDSKALATPYQWGNQEMEMATKSANELITKHFVGSGFTSLRKGMDSPQMGNLAKTYLKSLLEKHDIHLIREKDSIKRDIDELYGGSVYQQRVPLKVGSSDEEILELARDGKLSLFSSLLGYVENSKLPVATKTLLKLYCLAPKPGDLPGAIDTKEMVLAALYFLSSTLEFSSEEEVPSLPLIRPITPTADLEKRHYEIAGDWKLVDIREKVLRLEQIFISSPYSWKWLRRESFCPRLSHKDETSFMLKGVIPPVASAKKSRGIYNTKRKTVTSTTSTATSPTPTVPSAASSPVNNGSDDIGSVAETTVEQKEVPVVKPSVEEKPASEPTVQKDPAPESKALGEARVMMN